MIINHNISALNTYNKLSANNATSSKALEKLSSGLRINRAGDDAAGLAISEKMRGQIRGLDQATRNSQDGISLIQTAEGALNETHSILQRMRELAVQSASDTNTDTDRLAIQDEIKQLKSEVDRIANTTEFNTKKLLDGSIGVNAVIGTDNHSLQPITITDAELKDDTYTLTTTAAGTLSTTFNTNTTGLVAGDLDLTTSNIAGLKLGNYTLEVKENGANFDFSLKDKNGVEVAKANNVDYGAGDAVLTDGGGNTFTITTGGALQAGKLSFTLEGNYAAANAFAITKTGGGSVYSSAAATKLSSNTFDANGFRFDMTVDTVLSAAAASTIVVTNNAAEFQIGANAGQSMKVAIGTMDTATLGIDNIDLSTKAGAQTAVTDINDAIEKVSTQRAALGAYQNRLEHTINNLTTSSENLSAAESRVRDVDMAKEMMDFTKTNILSQAATAMLAQANQAPQGVLQLLK